ncbi:hypothetical protein NCS55_00438400 [Fusarium keratoplasticum]|nr:hypothetical protein NCS55_00438400 [Fusarium keratoplasticum]
MALPLRTAPNDVDGSTDRIETEIGNYITDFAAREVLITEWDQLRRSRIPVRYFTPIATGILMVAPLEILQDLLQSCKKAPDVFFDGVMTRLNKDSLTAIQSYVIGDRMDTIPWTDKENTATCILDGSSRRVDTLRLFPLIYNGQHEIHRLQSILEAFWGEKAASWIATFTNPDLVESPQNHISLGWTSQSLFFNARIAFKPLRSVDPNERRLQLHLLKPSAFRNFNSYFYDNPLHHAGLDAENTKTWGDGGIFTELQQSLALKCLLCMTGTDWDGVHDEDDGDDEDVEFFQLDQEQ